MAKDDFLNLFKLADGAGSSASRAFVGMLNTLPAGLTDQLEQIVKQGSKDQLDNWLSNVKTVGDKARAMTDEQFKAISDPNQKKFAESVRKISHADFEILCDNGGAVFIKLNHVRNVNAFRSALEDVVMTGRNPNIDSIMKKYGLADKNDPVVKLFIDNTENALTLRNTEIKGISESLTRPGSMFYDAATAKHIEDLVPEDRAAAIKDAATKIWTAQYQTAEGLGRREMLFGRTPSATRASSAQPGNSSNAAANTAETPSGSKSTGSSGATTNSSEPPAGAKSTASSGGGTTPPSKPLTRGSSLPPEPPRVAAANLDELQYRPIKPGLLSRAYNIFHRGEDSIPYGDFDAVAAQRKMDSGKFEEFVLPENKSGWVQLQSMFTPKGLKSLVSYAFTALTLPSSARPPLFFQSVPNFATDTMYIRPLIKEIDGRLHASGLSKGVYDLQVKMRDLTEAFGKADSPITLDQYREGLKKLHSDYMNVPENKAASERFVKSLEPIIKELENRKDSANIGNKLTDANGNAYSRDPKAANAYPASRVAFSQEALANGKNGLTAGQTESLLIYYRRMRDDAIAVANDPKFIESYFDRMPGRISDTNKREQIADAVASLYLGYNRQEGLSNGGLLSKMGSEAEARLTGKNLFLVDPKLGFANARHEVNAQLERLLERGMGSTAAEPRVTPHKPRSFDSNVEADIFTLFDRHKELDGKWDVGAQQDDARQLVDFLTFGSEEMVAQYIKRQSWLMGENSVNKTMDISQILLNGLNQRQAEALRAKDMRMYNAVESYKDMISNFKKQSPDEAGNRAANEWITNKYLTEVQLHTLFASDGKKSIPVPLLAPLMSPIASGLKALGNLHSPELGEKLYKLGSLKMDVVASAPQKYNDMNRAKNEYGIRTFLNFFLGVKTTPNHKSHYAMDEIHTGTILGFGRSSFEPDPAKNAFSNSMAKMIDKYDNLPMWLKTPTRVLTGAAVDAVDPNAKDKIGIMAPVVKTVWAGALATALYHGFSEDPDTKIEKAFTSLTAPIRLTTSTMTYAPYAASVPFTLVGQGIANTGKGVFTGFTGESHGWGDTYLIDPKNNPLFTKASGASDWIDRTLRFDGSGTPAPETQPEQPAGTIDSESSLRVNYNQNSASYTPGALNFNNSANNTRLQLSGSITPPATQYQPSQTSGPRVN